MRAWNRELHQRLTRIDILDSNMAENNVAPVGNNDVVENIVPIEKSLKEYFSPVAINHPSCIELPQTRATHFELKPSVIQLLPSFHGLESEDPYLHVKEFIKRYVLPSVFRIFQMSLLGLGCSHFL